jgi:hypothetical protein
MWTAAWNPPESGDDSTTDLASNIKRKSKKKESVTEVSISDFGSYLEDAYSVSVDRGDEPITVMGGTIGDALREARSKARLLVVLVPSARPGRGKKKTSDHEAIESLLSPEVAEVAEKNARRKVDSGSYIVWGAKASSPEAITAIKRLKAKQSSSKGDKRPVLVVAYPAQVISLFCLQCSRYLANCFLFRACFIYTCLIQFALGFRYWIPMVFQNWFLVYWHNTTAVRRRLPN